MCAVDSLQIVGRNTCEDEDMESIPLAGLRQAVEKVFEIVQELYNLTADRGGVVTVYDLDSGTFILRPLVVGNLSQEQVARYGLFAHEKAIRLAFRRENGHLSSRQSRCASQNMYGGAICLSDQPLIISFSGLPEIADEAFCVLLALTMPNLQLGLGDARQIAEFDDPVVNTPLLGYLDTHHGDT